MSTNFLIFEIEQKRSYKNHLDKMFSKIKANLMKKFVFLIVVYA